MGVPEVREVRDVMPRRECRNEKRRTPLGVVRTRRPALELLHTHTTSNNGEPQHRQLAMYSARVASYLGDHMLLCAASSRFACIAVSSSASYSLSLGTRRRLGGDERPDRGVLSGLALRESRPPAVSGDAPRLGDRLRRRPRARGLALATASVKACCSPARWFGGLSSLPSPWLSPSLKLSLSVSHSAARGMFLNVGLLVTPGTTCSHAA